nr:hypothetical protein [Tanacetum cinerariifolium]
MSAGGCRRLLAAAVGVSGVGSGVVMEAAGGDGGGWHRLPWLSRLPATVHGDGGWLLAAAVGVSGLGSGVVMEAAGGDGGGWQRLPWWSRLPAAVHGDGGWWSL